MVHKKLDWLKLRVYPLSLRNSMARLSDVLVNPDSPPPPCTPAVRQAVERCAQSIIAARQRRAAVVFMSGAHLVKNGGALLLINLMYQRWITHLAFNGASVIHDWEFASHGYSTENVAANVATGCFGAWDETGRYLHLALLAGGLDGLGFGASVGRMIQDDGVKLPPASELTDSISREPEHPSTPARADLLQAMRQHRLRDGLHTVRHPWKHNSIFGQAYRLGIPATVHPGIGYDIITNHPMFNGAAIGRAAQVDFQIFSASVADLSGGVVLSVGSSVMAPQIFEKSLSCVNNLRLQEGLPTIRDHRIFVVDLQDNGGWDWSLGEPPKDHPAYYLRFMKSFSRMGGAMQYIQCDNVLFLHNLLWTLNQEMGADE